MFGITHLPVNHPSRPLWRVIAGAVGVYLIAFGILGAIRSYHLPVFAQVKNTQLPQSLGLHSNLAFAVLSIVVGVMITAACLVGRNFDHILGLVGGVVFLLAGLAMLTLLRSDLNILGFTIETCIVSFIFGLIMLGAGLYTRTGSAATALQEETRRHRLLGSNTGVVGDA